MADAANGEVIGSEDIHRAQLVLESKGWTELRYTDGEVVAQDLDLYFLGTHPAKGTRTLFYRDPPWPHYWDNGYVDRD